MWQSLHFERNLIGHTGRLYCQNRNIVQNSLPKILHTFRISIAIFLNFMKGCLCISILCSHIYRKFYVQEGKKNISPTRVASAYCKNSLIFLEHGSDQGFHLTLSNNLLLSVYRSLHIFRVLWPKLILDSIFENLLKILIRIHIGRISKPWYLVNPMLYSPIFQSFAPIHRIDLHSL